MITDLKCPKCEPGRLNKFGFIWSGQNKRQRWVCLDCHRVTITPIIVKTETRAELSEGQAPVSRNNINGSIQW